MSSPQMAAAHAAPVPVPATTEMKLEVIVLPVADVDRAKRFYEGLGWRLDADFDVSETFRGVQFTPLGSPCSIHFGRGLTTAAPGSVQGLFLVVDDIDAARADLVSRGVTVSEPFHFDTIGGPPQPGTDPNHRSYSSYATFSDPDGNSWRLQEVGTRLPGRGLSNDVPTLTELLRETETHHGEYEPKAPKHHWSVWYGAYMIARQRGAAPDDAAAQAGRAVDAAIGRS